MGASRVATWTSPSIGTAERKVTTPAMSAPTTSPTAALLTSRTPVPARAGTPLGIHLYASHRRLRNPLRSLPHRLLRNGSLSTGSREADSEQRRRTAMKRECAFVVAGLVVAA